MIIFHCPCGYTWILDLEAAQAIGPVYAVRKYKDLDTSSNELDEPDLFIGNKEKYISFGALRDFYADCWGIIERKITS